MGWLFLEIALALAIAGGIVWWTLPRKPKPGTGEGASAPPPREKPPADQ